MTGFVNDSNDEQGVYSLAFSVPSFSYLWRTSVHSPLLPSYVHELRIDPSVRVSRDLSFYHDVTKLKKEEGRNVLDTWAY
jgi:hypothetical protein